MYPTQTTNLHEKNHQVNFSKGKLAALADQRIVILCLDTVEMF